MDTTPAARGRSGGGAGCDGYGVVWSSGISLPGGGAGCDGDGEVDDNGEEDAALGAAAAGGGGGGGGGAHEVDAVGRGHVRSEGATAAQGEHAHTHEHNACIHTRTHLEIKVE